jgi:hypothetical protein
MGRIIPYIMEHKKCSKPPTSLIHLEVKPCKNHGFAVQIVPTKSAKPLH